MSDFVKVGSKKDFPNNQTREISVGNQSLCLAHVNGTFFAYDNSCTHAAAPLSDCPIEEGKISCPLHGAKFDMKTGSAITLPATEPLKGHDIKIDGDDILVRKSS